MEIEKILEQFGLNEKEAKVYIACLQLGKGTVLHIAKRASLKRPNTYLILEDLFSKKLVNIFLESKKKYYTAESPTKLLHLLELKKELLNQALPQLTAFYNNPEMNKPYIRYYEGTDGLRNIWDETLTIKDKMMYWISPIKDLVETVGKEYLEEYVKRRAKKGLWIQTLRVSAREEIEYKYKNKETFEKTLRITRFVPKEFDIRTTIIIYGNNVAIISGEKKFGIVVESKEISSLMKIFYDLLWNISK